MSDIFDISQMTEEDIKLQYITPALTAKWDIKKRILHHEYRIEWQSPKDLNPRIVFD